MVSTPPQPGATPPTTYRPKLRTLLGFTAAGCVVLVLLYLPLFLFGPGVSRMRFDSPTWKAAPATGAKGSVRQRMVDDLLRSHPLVGKTRPEVEALIGPPDDTPYFRGYEMVYLLGPERNFMSIDSEWLVIKLDAAGRVVQARLITD